MRIWRLVHHLRLRAEDREAAGMERGRRCERPGGGEVEPVRVGAEVRDGGGVKTFGAVRLRVGGQRGDGEKRWVGVWVC
eukprot:4827225-Pleurochrysis_carterae.AAC.1